jgi:hypothetical protein
MFKVRPRAPGTSAWASTATWISNVRQESEEVAVDLRGELGASVVQTINLLESEYGMLLAAVGFH